MFTAGQIDCAIRSSCNNPVNLKHILADDSDRAFRCLGQGYDKACRCFTITVGFAQGNGACRCIGEQFIGRNFQAIDSGAGNQCYVISHQINCCVIIRNFNNSATGGKDNIAKRSDTRFPAFTRFRHLFGCAGMKPGRGESNKNIAAGSYNKIIAVIVGG